MLLAQPITREKLLESNGLSHSYVGTTESVRIRFVQRRLSGSCYTGRVVYRFSFAKFTLKLRKVSNNSAISAFATSWSRDSQQTATVGGSCNASRCVINRVFHINRDGSDFRVLYYSPDVELQQVIAWSPEGKLVAVKLTNGQAYTIDVACQSNGLGGCAEDSRTPISDIPVDWLPTFRPQWGGTQSSP
jgi:Tol biopolymer transport system component